MVSIKRPHRERAQLLLVTAIIMAIIILGLAVLLNAAVTTDVRAPDDPSTDITESERLGLDFESGVAGLGAYINADGPWAGASELEDYIESNLTTFNDAMFEAVGDRRATLANIRFNDVSFGTLVADGDRESDLAKDDEDRRVILDETDSAEVYGLTFSMNVSSLEDDVENATGVELRGADNCVLFSFINNGTHVELVESDVECGTDNITNTTTVDSHEPEGNYTRFVIGQDQPVGDAALFADGFGDLEPDGTVYGLSILNPAASKGGYRILVGTTDFEDKDYYDDFEPEEDHPYVASLIWTVDIDVHQRARASERSVTRTVDIYPDEEYIRALGVPW